MNFNPTRVCTQTQIFATADHHQSERKTQWVILLTAVTMIAEIIAGHLYGSMALLADGWHMGTHVAALSITAWAYFYARHHADDTLYSFGTGKVSALGGFTSGIILLGVAVLMGVESLQRILTPQLIQFNQALLVAILGLVVNLASLWLLQEQHPHPHPHSHSHGAPDHDHDHDHDHDPDHNLRAAYLHVLADALTSLLAIIALLFGRTFGWLWLDPSMGIVGAIIIARWSVGLLRQTSSLLLDTQTDPALLSKIRATIEADTNNRITDLHLWRIAPNQLVAIITVTTASPRPPQYYKDLLVNLAELVHITVEVQPWENQ